MLREETLDNHNILIKRKSYAFDSVFRDTWSLKNDRLDQIN